MGESVTEGTIARWVKAVGDPVKEGETVVEVTTDKVDVEVPSTATGRLAEIIAAEGATVEVGGTLATVAVDAPVSDGDGAAPASSAPETPQPARAPEPLQPVARPQPPAAPAATSPIARRRAAIHGIDRHGADGTPQVAEGETPDVIRGPAAALVEHMERSRDIPTATSFRTIAVDVLDARRRELNTALSAAGAPAKVSFTHLIGYAVAKAAVEKPEMTAHFARTADGKPARVPGGSHLGLAVDSTRKDGARFLVVPVIRDAGQRSFDAFRKEYERLIERARGTAPTADELQGATSLVKAHRTHGHLGAHLDPLGTPPIGDPAMDPVTYGLTPELMARIPADLLRVYVPGKTLADVLPALQRTYCGTIAFEIEHIASHEQRVWLREHIESGAYRLPFSDEEKLRLLCRLTKLDAMERYLRRTFIGQKTFSIEGLDAMVPMLETLLTLIADDGINEVVMGMAHRGRLAVVAHVANRPYESILNSFELGEVRRAVGQKEGDVTGDVKYHLGTTGTYVTHTGKSIGVRLLPNPSHLEAVDPVVEGWTRSEQTHRHAAELHLDAKAALPVLIHGDAAFVGQGVVAEVLNLQSLAGYTTGGTLHLIADNQVGFTTDPEESRSTRHASDMAKGFDIPIVHVNADDVEACLAAVRFAYDYRRTYERDVVIDLIGYRRFGHNETDEPAYTQPLMYQRIRQHPTAREIFAKRLIEDGLVTRANIDAEAEAAYARIAAAHKRVKANLETELDAPPAEERRSELEDIALRTKVKAATLRALNDELLSFPEGFAANAKLVRQMERRRASLTEAAVDWGTAEALAFASLLTEGHPIRLTGQDTVRGTFSQRHLAFHDEKTGDVWIPMQHVREAQATFEVHNSPLSEVACVGFEYGYSAADPETFVLWEAQYGDFVNNAEMVVDQFISSGRAKWGQRSRLTLLLPHGYEGSGPEHSSARIERFLQLSADGNWRVANCSTSAQYFHLLRNQGLSTDPRPLVIFTPKSLLRLVQAASPIAELSDGAFATVLDDPTASQPEEIRTLLLCSGRIYYDLTLSPLRAGATDVAIARVELLYPLPLDDILATIARYPNLEQCFWVQEEPANMGAWNYLQRQIGVSRPYDIRWDYIGRPRRASSSEGFTGSHHLEQERVVKEALGTSRVAARGGAAPTAGTRDRT